MRVKPPPRSSPPSGLSLPPLRGTPPQRPLRPHFVAVYPLCRKPSVLLTTFCLLARLAFLFACPNKNHKNSCPHNPHLATFLPLIARKCCAFFVLPSLTSRRLAYPSLSPPFAPNSVQKKWGGIILPKRQAFLPQKIRRFFL